MLLTFRWAKSNDRSGPRRTIELTKYLSTDNDPLYRFHQWQANLRVLEITEIKTVPGVPSSHPFVERLIGTLRRECLDRTLFWTTADLDAKLLEFQRFYNGHRAHAGLKGRLPEPGGRRIFTTNKLLFLPVAEPLSRVIPDPSCRVIS
jgi:transposase InsO family protein